MPIPEMLAKAPIWTLSGKDKIPLDPIVLKNNSYRVGFSKKSEGLLPLANVLTLKKSINDDTLYPAMRLEATRQFTVCDIEPQEHINSNPWLKLPFVYLETSRNGGYHGILPIRYNESFAKRVAIKDKNNDAEFIMDRHFLTLTQMEIEVPKENLAISLSDEFQKALAEKIELILPKHELFEIDDEELKNTELHALLNQKLKPQNQKLLYKLNLRKVQFKPSDDKSIIEAQTVTRIAGKLLYFDKTLAQKANRSQLLTMTNIAATALLPKRKKHYKVSNYSDVGRASYFDRLIYKIVNHLLQEEEVHE